MNTLSDRCFTREEIATGETSNAFPGKLSRVLYAVVLDPATKFGSLEEQIVSLAQAFAMRGGLFFPLFICREGVSKESFQTIGIEAECLDLRTFSWSRLVRLSRLISAHKITLVHWNFTEMLCNGYLWWLSVLHPRVRHFFTDHVSRTSEGSQPSGLLKSAFKRLLLRRYSKVICVSEFIFDDLKNQGACSNLVLCRHFINTERFRPDARVRDDLRRRHNVKGCFVVLAVAHLIKAKGIDVLIRAMAQLPDRVRLWIVGDGVESAALQQLSAELHLLSRVYFYGHQKDVAPFMQAADCLACPSLWAEATGLVNLEAAASGLPVIASRIGGIPEYVENGRTGFLFSPGDHCELAQCIRLIQDDPVLFETMSGQARVHAAEKFTADAGVREHLQLYWE
jgi:glycosyltransferase involved in cell wall biosynthesis